MKLSKRIISLVLTLALCVGLFPQLASAEVTRETPEGKPLEFTDTNGETVEVDETTWEELYPYGVFLFPDGETNIVEGGEPGTVKVFRLGGTDGRVTAFVTYQPNITALDEEGEKISYANAAGTDDIVIEVEDPQPIAAYQPIGRPAQPEKGDAALLDAPYTGEEALENDRVLTVDADAEAWQWYACAYGLWQKVQGATKAEFVVDAESLEEYDFRCVYTVDGVDYCTESYKGEAYEKEPEDVLTDMPEDLPLNPEKTFSTLETQEDPYLGYIIPVTFADGEWVKEIRVTAPEDDEAEAIKVGMFTLVDNLGADIYSGAATQTLTVMDNDEAEPFSIGLTRATVEADKSDGVAEIRVKRDGGSQTMVTVEYSTADGTAKAGRDYEATTGTLGFYGDVDEAVIQIPLINDGIASSEELTFTLTLGEVKGDSQGLCTLVRTETQVVLTNSAAGDTADNLVTMLYDAEAVDASGSVEITDSIAAPVDSHVVTGEQVVIGEDEIIYATVEDGVPVQGDDAALMTYNYDRLSFPQGNDNYWTGTASIAGKAPNDYSNWSGGAAKGNGWELTSKTAKSVRLRIPYMEALFSGFRGSFNTSFQWADDLTTVFCGDEFTYGAAYMGKNGWERIIPKPTPVDSEAGTSKYYYYPSWSYNTTWALNDSVEGVELALERWDCHDSEEPAYSRITNGTLTRRVFSGDMNLRVHTANDGESGNGNVATAPKGAAALTKGSSVYSSIKPQISLVPKKSGVNSSGKLYVGSELRVSIGQLDSYAAVEKKELNAAVFVTRSDGSVMASSTEGRDTVDPNGSEVKTRSGPRITRSGKDYFITMVWDNMTPKDLADTYTINVVMTRVQSFNLDIRPSVPRMTGTDGTATRNIDVTRVGEAWDGFWKDYSGSRNAITVGCSEAMETAPYFKTSITESYIGKPSDTSNPLYNLGTWENLQYINFNRSEDDRIVFNGRMYKGNETIWLDMADLANGSMTFLYYKQSFLNAESTMNLAVGRAELYFDGDGDGIISGAYNNVTGYFNIRSGAPDELVMVLDRDAGYNEALFQPVDLGNGKFGEYYLKVYYTMTPRSLGTPAGREGNRAQVIPAFTTSVTDKTAYARLTEEQRSYRYVLPAMNADGSGRTSDGHLMYGPEASAVSFVDLPLGGDRSPVVTEGSVATGFRYSWTPRFSGSLLYPFSDPEPIVIAHSQAGDNVPLADISYDEANKAIKTEADGKRNLNGYLGSFVADTTAALCVLEQQRTADQLKADPASVDTLAPESTELIRRSATPNPNHLGSVSFQSVGDTSVNPDESGNKYSNMIPDTKVDLPMMNTGLLGLGNVIMNRDEVMMSISVPLVGGGSMGGKSFKAAAPTIIGAVPASQWVQTAGLLNSLKKGSAPLKDMLTDPNQGGYDQTGNQLKSKFFVVSLAFTAVFSWKYDTVQNEYYFKSFGGGLAGMLMFNFTIRFVPCPILYLYIAVNLIVSVSTGGTIQHTEQMRATPYISPDRPRTLHKGDAVGFTLDKQNISVQFTGKIYIEVLDKEGGALASDGVKGYLLSDGSEAVRRKLTTAAGLDFPGGGTRYVRIVALGESVITNLNVVEKVESKLVWSGLTVAPDFALEVGLGLGVEGLKVEGFIKLSVSASMTFAQLQADGSRSAFSFDLFSAGIGFDIRLVFFGLSWEMELIGIKISYIKGMGWVSGWTKLGKDQLIGPIGGKKSDAKTQSDEEEETYLKPLEDASGTQKIYSGGGGGAELMAYDSEDPAVPFQLSGYNSSVTSFKLADGLSLGNDYQVVTLDGVNYVLYTISRENAASPMDRQMLVLSRLVSTGGMDRVGLYNPRDFKTRTDANGKQYVGPEMKEGRPVDGQPGESQPVYSSIPYIPVDTVDGQDDGTGDLEFRGTVDPDGKTLRVTWVSYAQTGSEANVRGASGNTVVKTATFDNVYSINGDVAFTRTETVSGQPGKRVLMPTALDGRTVAYVEAEPMTDSERAEATDNYLTALKAAGYDINSSDDAVKDIAKRRLVMQQALWDGNGKRSNLCVSVDGSVTKLPLPEGQTVENIEFTRSGDRYYAAYTTRELRFTDAAGNALATAGDAANLLTVHRLFLTYFTVGGDGTVAWANGGQNVLLRTLYDYENNRTLSDGVYTGGAVAAYKEPYFANLQFLNAPLGDALKGDPESFTLMAGDTPEDFLLFEMNGSTYVIRQGSLESITGPEHRGTVIPFFATDEGFSGTSADGTASSSGRAEVTIGADGNGGLAAVYVANVPSTGNNGLFMSKYDPATGTWGKGVILAMNHMSVLEDSLVQGWDPADTEKAFLGELEGYDKGGLDQFTFASPKIALGTRGQESAAPGAEEQQAEATAGSGQGSQTTLLVLTQGNMNYLKHATLPASGSGDRPVDTLVFDKETAVPQGKPPRGTGMYALSYGLGQQTVGKASLSFLTYDFSAGAQLHATLSFENTGDVSIRGSADTDQAITVGLTAGGGGMTETTLATWTVKENIVPGQKVTLEGNFTLPETMPVGSQFGITVSEGSYYEKLGMGTPYTAKLNGVLTVEEKPELRFETSSIALAGQNGVSLTLDGISPVLNVDFVAGNRGNRNAENVYAQFSYDTGKTDGNGNKIYAPMSISSSSLTVGGEEELAALQAYQTGDDRLRGILYLGSVKAGYGRRVNGTITLAQRFFKGQSGTLGLHIELFSDADSGLSTDRSGLRSATHGEYNTEDNLLQQTVDPFDAFTVSGKLLLPKGHVVRLPIQYSAATGSKMPQIKLTEHPDKEDRDGDTRDGSQNMERLLNRLYYEPRSYKNSMGTGTVVVSAAKTGSGYIRISDENTNTYLDFPFEVIEGDGGIPVYPGNGRLTFYNPDKTVWDAASSSESWKAESYETAGGAGYRSQGKNGASFSFDTEAESIELYFTGTVEVSSTYRDYRMAPSYQAFKPQTVQGSSPTPTVQELEPRMIRFGNNDLNRAHTVTITVKEEGTWIYRVVEHYAHGDPEDQTTPPKFIWSAPFPKKESIRFGPTDRPKVSMQVDIVSGVPLSAVSISGAKPTGFWGISYNQSWKAISFDVRYNGVLTVTATDVYGRQYSQKVVVDWFVYDAALAGGGALMADGDPEAVPDPDDDETYVYYLYADDEFENEPVEEPDPAVDATPDRWMTAALEENAATPYFRVKVDRSAPQEYALILAGPAEKIADLIDAPSVDTSKNPEAQLEGYLGKYVFVAERGEELTIPAREPGINVVFAYCCTLQDLLEDYDDYTYVVERADGTVDTYNALDELDYNVQLFEVPEKSSATPGSGGSWSGGSSSGGGTSSGGTSTGTAAQPETPAQTAIALTEAEKDALLKQFDDLNVNSWYRDGIAFVLQKGIMNGVSDGSFAPDTAASRAMIVTMLYRLEGRPEYRGMLRFTDVEADSWYTDAVRWATSEGIVNGYSESSFAPDDRITREQLATILYRYARSKGGEGFETAETFSLSYSDAATVSAWAEEAMRWMVKNAIVTGMGDGTLNPGGQATRAQVATMLMRYNDLMEEGQAK